MHSSLLRTVALCAASLLASASAAFSQIAYMSAAGEPWNSSSNIEAMDLAFGSGNWTRTTFGGTDASALEGYSFVYIDGGNGNSSQFVSFLSSNRTGLESWVAAGGHLFLNAATWSQPVIDLGFGVTLTESFSTPGTAVDAMHPIFQGPEAVATSYTGDWFSHNILTGAGLDPIMSGTGGTILASLNWGDGFVLFGGITTPNFHDGDNPLGLRANQLVFAAEGALPPVVPVPEPSTYGLIGAGVLCGLVLWRRRNAKA